jgi:membrane protein
LILGDLAAMVRTLFGVVVDRIRRHPILGEVYELIDGIAGDYVRDHGPMYAGALAFYAILSLIPLIILFASLSGFVLAGDQALDETFVQIKKIIPYLQPQFEDDLRGIIAMRKGLGLVGLFALMVSASEVFRAVEFALARIFARLDHEIPTDAKARPRNYFKSKLLFSVVVTSTVMTYLALRLFAGILRHVGEVLNLPPGMRAVLDDPLSGATPAGQVITAVAIILGFVVVVKAFTHRTVVGRYALAGGAIFYVAFQAAHRVYDFYLQKLAKIGAMYGSFATLIVVILWIYFSATLLLLCCHAVKTVQRRVMVGPRWPKDKLPG